MHRCIHRWPGYPFPPLLIGRSQPPVSAIIHIIVEVPFLSTRKHIQVFPKMSNYLLSEDEARGGVGWQYKRSYACCCRRGHVSEKCSTGYIFTRVPIQTDVWHTHRQLEKWRRPSTVVWTTQIICVSLSYFTVPLLNRKKNKRNYRCMSLLKIPKKQSGCVFMKS